MLRFLLVSLSVALYMLHRTSQVNALNATEFWCDDAILKDILNKLVLIEMQNKNLHLKVDMQNMGWQQELAAQKHNLEELTKALLSGNANALTTSATKQHLSTALLHLSDVQTLPSSCAEAMLTHSTSGVYTIQLPNTQLPPFDVYCLKADDNGTAWTIVQRRQDGASSFERDWQSYKEGFGFLEAEFFIGLEKLHAITQAARQELWIKLVDFADQIRYAKYKLFAIDNERIKYALNSLGEFTGDAGDSMRIHYGMKFSTFDADNDGLSTKNCAASFKGGWWYNGCHHSNLNGKYLRGEYSKDLYGQGIDWNSWHGHTYSLKYVHMAVRPVK